jgi:hypothetical protein
MDNRYTTTPTSSEGFPLSRKDERSNLRIILKLLHSITQIPHEFVAESIQGFRPIQRYEANITLSPDPFRQNVFPSIRPTCNAI